MLLYWGGGGCALMSGAGKMTRLSEWFPSLKNPHSRSHQTRRFPTTSTATPCLKKNSKASSPPSSSTSSPGSPRPRGGNCDSKVQKVASRWSVYLIVSSRLPRTYVGATTNFSRRLKQHNGELKGGAKASCAGRPWACACTVQGFKDQSEACQFESKWKNISRKLTRKREKEDKGSDSLIRHRKAALSRVTSSLDCNHLQILWLNNSS